MSTADALLALGSNLGDRGEHLESAIASLDQHTQVAVIARSTFHETRAVGPPQPDYLNAALRIRTGLEPRPLLDTLLAIETAHGRTRNVRWGPRTLDLDLLFYGQQIVNEPGLRVPHPRLAERLFVLSPLREIASDWVHPVLGLTVEELYNDLKSKRR